MHLSARSMVACFCVVIVAASPILLSLLSQATDEALNHLVPPWDSALTKSASTSFESQIHLLESILGDVLESLEEVYSEYNPSWVVNCIESNVP